MFSKKPKVPSVLDNLGGDSVTVARKKSIADILYKLFTGKERHDPLAGSNVDKLAQLLEEREREERIRRGGSPNGSPVERLRKNARPLAVGAALVAVLAVGAVYAKGYLGGRAAEEDEDIVAVHVLPDKAAVRPLPTARPKAPKVVSMDDDDAVLASTNRPLAQEPASRVSPSLTSVKPAVVAVEPVKAEPVTAVAPAAPKMSEAERRELDELRELQRLRVIKQQHEAEDKRKAVLEERRKAEEKRHADEEDARKKEADAAKKKEADAKRRAELEKKREEEARQATERKVAAEERARAEAEKKAETLRKKAEAEVHKEAETRAKEEAAAARKRAKLPQDLPTPAREAQSNPISAPSVTQGGLPSDNLKTELLAKAEAVKQLAPKVREDGGAVQPRRVKADQLMAELSKLVVYPPQAAEEGLAGTTTLLLAMTKEGRVLSVRIQEGSGYKSLDAAAVRAARQLPVLPAYAGQELSLPVVFRLN